MNTTLRIAVVVVTGALIAYSIAVFTEQRKRTLTPFILGALATGVLFDATATVLMILGSHHIPVTIHGLLGYSAFAAMLTDTVLLFRSGKKVIRGASLSQGLHFYTRGAYLWWVATYLTGGFLAMHGLK